MVTIYTTEYCSFCSAAKALLKQRGVPFTEVPVSRDDDSQWETLRKKSGMMTMPQIFHGDRLIGGFQELAALDRSDGLASLKG